MSEPIALDPADYWRLIAMQERARAAKAEADVAQLRGLLRAQAEGGKAGAVFDELAKKYSLDATTSYQADDATCTMTEQEK